MSAKHAAKTARHKVQWTAEDRARHAYRIRIRNKPNRAYIEVREDQLELVEPGVNGSPA